MTEPAVRPSSPAPSSAPGKASGWRRLSQWWLDRSVPVKGLIVIAIPMIALAGVTTSAFVLQLEEQAERQIAITANAVARSSLAVLGDAVDAETGMRGYAATGDVSFLATYKAGIARLHDDLGDLRAAASNDVERAQVAVIEQHATDHERLLESLGAAVESGANDGELIPLLKDGKEVMDGLRGDIGMLADEPTRLIAQKRDDINSLEESIQLVQTTGLLLGLLAGVAGMVLFSVGISRRVRATAANAVRLGAGEALAPIPRAADELGRLGVALADTERLLQKRLDELSAARDQALSATEAKNTFLSRTSHELRTPLNAILGFAQLLEMSELNEDDRECAEHINNAGRHLLSLINELIDIARVESGDLQVSVEPVSIAAVSQEIVALMTPLAAARDITIDNQVLDRSVGAAADHQRLKQVLVNLVSNAVKYNRQAGNIAITYETDIESIVRLTVTDTGPGLTASDVERIWMPFERLGADRGAIEGTGIGLPLARALTEAMNGTLTVTSEPGRGSAFTIQLPRSVDLTVTPPSSPAPVSPQPCSDTGASHPFTVLSIEDNIANSQVLERIFRPWPSITLIAADNAEDGIALAHARRPDLILLDLHLPEVSGEQAFTALRAEPATADIPIVILSADATPGTIRRLLGRGAAGYLTKPLELDQLYSVLKTTLHKPIPLVSSEPQVSVGTPSTTGQLR